MHIYDARRTDQRRVLEILNQTEYYMIGYENVEFKTPGVLNGQI